VATDKLCILAGDNPDVSGPTSSGHLNVNSQPSRLILDFKRTSGMDAGTYKFCIKLRGDLADWKESGVSLTLQTSVSSVSVNGVVEVVASVPMRAGSKLSLCKNSDCSGKFESPASAPRMVSFIPRDANCRETTNVNPPVRPLGENVKFSGHIEVDPKDGSLSQTKVDTMLASSSSAAGVLQMCIKEDDAVGFVPTGITLELQNDIVGLEVNGLTPTKWWHVAAPKASGSTLQFTSSKVGVPGDSIALIHTTSLCSSLCRTRSKDRCRETDLQSFSVSGFWSAHGTDKVFSTKECLNDDQSFAYACWEMPGRRVVDMSLLSVGLYKACFRKAAASAYFTGWSEWQGTGLQVEVQNVVSGFAINSAGSDSAGGILNPQQGQAVVIPRKPFHTLTYFGSISTGGKLKMLSKKGDCSQYSATSSAMPLGANQIAQATPGVQISGTQVDAFLNLRVGLYQVCYLPKDTVQFLSTGVSFRIQNYTEGLEVNGIRPNRGLRISIPKRKSVRLGFFRKIGDMDIGDKISLIRREDNCFNPDQNIEAMPSHPSSGTCSGHMVVAALPLIGDAGFKALMGSSAVERMSPDIYKVCFKHAASPAGTYLNNGFLETGLTVTIQNQLPFAIINAREPLAVMSQWHNSISAPSNLGVRLTAPKADKIIFTLPELGVAVAGKLSLIGADLDCSSPSENPAETRLVQMHLRTEAYGVGSQMFKLQQSRLDSVMGTFGVLEPGMYQICFAPEPVGVAQFEFVATGISFRLQDELTQMIVNGVRPNYGLRVALPKSKKNVVHFEGAARGGAAEVEKAYSFIRVGQDCSLISYNNVSQTSETSGYIRTGTVSPSDFHLPVAQTDRMQGQALGLYQVCHRSNEADGILFSYTGLMVTLQDQLRRLKQTRFPRSRAQLLNP